VGGAQLGGRESDLTVPEFGLAIMTMSTVLLGSF
jgi:hypothetical protein